ncbi:MAG: hypothetical protein U0163_14230 [Gemmatimonadaceae bacterium]
MSGSRSTLSRTRAPIVVLLLLTMGCISYVKSTSGGRKEARRECLAAARAKGWNVLNISDAVFRGAAHYEVQLATGQPGSTAVNIICSYDFREHTVDLRQVTP